MSTALTHQPSSYYVPPSQNTAPVLEFRCLYTRDLRRKAKRWQDGHLRFHTFNKRIMVYDEPRNFIGDTHWIGAADHVDDGDELTLERSGILVQVAEYECTLQTDLTGLWARKTPKESPPGPVHAPQGPTNPRPQTPRPPPAARAPVTAGKSSLQSGVQMRQVSESRQPAPPPVPPDSHRGRRPKDDEDHIPLWEILKTSRSTKPRAPLTPVVSDHNRSMSSKKKKQSKATAPAPAGQGRIKVRETIDLISQDDNVPDDLAVAQSNTARPDAANLATANLATANPLPIEPYSESAPRTDRKKRASVGLAEHPAAAAESQPPARPQKRTKIRDGQNEKSVSKVISLSKVPRTPVRAFQPPSSPPVSTTNHLPSPAQAVTEAPIRLEASPQSRLPALQVSGRPDQARPCSPLRPRDVPNPPNHSRHSSPSRPPAAEQECLQAPPRERPRKKQRIVQPSAPQNLPPQAADETQAEREPMRVDRQDAEPPVLPPQQPPSPAREPLRIRKRDARPMLMCQMAPPKRRAPPPQDMPRESSAPREPHQSAKRRKAARSAPIETRSSPEPEGDAVVAPDSRPELGSSHDADKPGTISKPVCTTPQQPVPSMIPPAHALLDAELLNAQAEAQARAQTAAVAPPLCAVPDLASDRETMCKPALELAILSQPAAHPPPVESGNDYGITSSIDSIPNDTSTSTARVQAPIQAGATVAIPDAVSAQAPAPAPVPALDQDPVSVQAPVQAAAPIPATAPPAQAPPPAQASPAQASPAQAPPAPAPVSVVQALPAQAPPPAPASVVQAPVQAQAQARPAPNPEAKDSPTSTTPSAPAPVAAPPPAQKGINKPFRAPTRQAPAPTPHIPNHPAAHPAAHADADADCSATATATATTASEDSRAMEPTACTDGAAGAWTREAWDLLGRGPPAARRGGRGLVGG